MFELISSPTFFPQAVAIFLLLHLLYQVHYLRMQTTKLIERVARLEGKLCGP